MLRKEAFHFYVKCLFIILLFIIQIFEDFSFLQALVVTGQGGMDSE